MADLKPIHLEDLPALAGFCGAFNPERPDSAAGWLARFQCWWDANPVFTADTPRGWWLAAGGQPVGMLAAIPFPLWVQDREVTACTVGTWRVAPGHRGDSLKLLLKLVAVGRDRYLLAATPTDLVARILRFQGFSSLVGPICQGLVPLVEPFAGVLARDHPRLQSWPRWLTGPLVSFRQSRRLARLGARVEATTLMVHLETAFGVDFDELWRRTRGLSAFTASRRRGVLDWYLRQNPLAGDLFLLAGRRTDGVLVGYLLVRRESIGGDLSRIGWVCLDLWCDPGEGFGLLAGMIRHGLATGVERLRLPHYHEEIARACAEAGLPEGGLRQLPIYLKPPEGCPSPQTLIHLSRNMGDYGL